MTLKNTACMQKCLVMCKLLKISNPGHGFDSFRVTNLHNTFTLGKCQVGIPIIEIWSSIVEF